MKQLYPIGTQLITRRLSQAVLYSELFNTFPGSSVDKNFKSYCYIGKITNLTEKELKTLNSFILIGDSVYEHSSKDCVWHDDAWRVTVTEKNQKWLSPVPIQGDLGHFVVNENFDGKPFLEYGVIYEDEGSFWLNKPDVCPEVIITNPLNVIEKRTYPDGQREPLIIWDEVILPEGVITNSDINKLF